MRSVGDAGAVHIGGGGYGQYGSGGPAGGATHQHSAHTTNQHSLQTGHASQIATGHIREKLIKYLVFLLSYRPIRATGNLIYFVLGANLISFSIEAI